MPPSPPSSTRRPSRPATRGRLDSVKNGDDGVTAHSIAFDAVTSERALYVAPGFDVPAPEAEPVIFDLTDVFGRLAELSGD